MVCYSMVSCWRLAITFIIYLIFCSTWDFDFGYHNECQDSKLDSSWFSLAKDDDDPNGGYSDAGLMDLWVYSSVNVSKPLAELLFGSRKESCSIRLP